jgi:predicted GH43/DUF377 family glycosyl hydrolase
LTSPVPVTRSRLRLTPDPRRVIAKPYLPGEEITPGGDSRSGLLMQRVLAIPEAEVSGLLDRVVASFGSRHRRYLELLEEHQALVAHHIGRGIEISKERRLLIGAYFSHEYSVEAAALLNPSIVLAPDQSGCAPGQARFVMSLRAVGEGHISSIEFRSGIIEPSGELTFDPPGEQLVVGQRTAPARYRKTQFQGKLSELGADNALTQRILNRLEENFTRPQLERALAWLEENGPPQAILHETIKMIRVLSASSYVTTFPADSKLSERVIFPAGPHETRGMEDARFVRFSDGDGSVRYYATYTAFDGFEILPQLIETEDFTTFAVSTLEGGAAQNKGMALFPRPVGGYYRMLSRKDRENLFLSTSGDVHTWNETRELHRPSAPWELLQIGNCGSPLETEAGWLVLTHGVGPMRTYAIGAILLALEDPGQVIGRLKEPLLTADSSEREGYVPNVLYSCGGIIHRDQLVLPYGFSDCGVTVARCALPELLTELRRGF